MERRAAVGRRLARIGLAAVTLALALLVTGAPRAGGFTMTGVSLGLDQRHFRVFNNFTDATANDNQTPHPEFPGALGADMAIWKGVVEWGSLLHATGAGDPHQPGGLGSGGANFDASYQGSAPGVGGVGDNVISATSLSLGGALFATLEGGSTGWRIRLADGDFVFDDGPGTDVVGVDIQGTATHMYGHALGLGHSSSPSSSMFPVSGSGVAERSIEADDIAGLQAVYGAISPTKPRITAVLLNGSVMTLTGSNFDPTGNEVWFTQEGPSTGAPLKVVGVASAAGGTEITLALPSGVAAGDVLVKRQGSGGDALSNAWPYNPSGLPAPDIAAVSPPVVEVLAPGARVVTVMGSGFTGVTGVSLDGTDVSAVPFGGAFTVVSDGQIDVELPLVAGSGTFDLALSGPAGSDTAPLTVDPVASPVLAVAQPDVVPAVGLDFAVSAAEADIVFLLFSPFDGPTVVPGVISLDIGSGVVSSIFNLKAWLIGPALVRTQHFGPLDDLAPGIELNFQGWVFEAANGYAVPWNATNAVQRVVAD